MILLKDAFFEIKNTKNKGRGIFAKKDIPKGTVIGDYLGKVLHPLNTVIDENNIYLMYYHDTAVISPNLERQGVHLLNHSCLPNAFLYIYKGHTLAFALRKIKAGEEITIPYLLPPIDKFCNPCKHICKCGNLKCTKTMHLTREQYEKWRKINRIWALKTKRVRISYNKELKTLAVYPKTIPAKYINSVSVL